VPPPHLVLRCEDVGRCASFYRDVLGVPVHNRDAEHVDVGLGPVIATLAPAAEDGGVDRGVILEVEVADIREAVREIRNRGARVLVGPVLTDWDTESAFIEGPDAVLVELYRPRPSRGRR
jgi:catechol 2,3-dioxygenase-like lactoylglutathione lyase family enzyme